MGRWFESTPAHRKVPSALSSPWDRSDDASTRGYVVFATDPNIPPEESGYREVYATEAKTPNQAMAKVKPIADDRRLRAYLATGRYRDELAGARWVA